jgi:hypothetical protein
VEVLSGNIGYLKFNAFMDLEVSAPTVVAAMGFLANTDAVIICAKSGAVIRPW